MTVVEWFQRAQREKWALGQFNISSLEVLQGIVDAANEAQAPLLVGVSMGSLRHIGLPYLAGLVQGAKAAASVPIFFHLDHGDSFETVQKAISAGFESVMIDASRMTYDNNVHVVRQVVEYARAHGVGVEAQIGETWDEETGDLIETHTEPAQVRPYAEATGVDTLAISFGNTPGRQEGQADVDLDLIAACAQASPVPIVLHGGTSVPDDAMRRAIASGAAKVNIDTAIRQAVTQTLQAAYAGADVEHDPRRVFRDVRAAVRQVVLDKMRLFGSVHRT
jgi:fructose-bisphosphate aldolase, class II